MKKLTIITLITLAIMSSCKKENIMIEETYKAPDSSYGLIYDKILVKSCALSGCHANEDHSNLNHQHGVTLEGEAVYNDLLNLNPKNSLAIKAGLKMVVKNSIDQSFFYQKINYENSKHQYGAPMPGGGLTLTPSQILFVKEWIMAGAPKEGHVVDKTLINK